jgi:type II secretory pathway predicted ATPase ExeA
MQSETTQLQPVAGIVPTQNFIAVDKRITETVRKNGMLAIIGSTGMGKSTGVEIIIGKLRERRNTVIEILPVLLKNRDATGSIVRRMITELSGEKPAGDIIARATQLRRVLISQAATRSKVILVIDEAQDLHPDTLYGLKKMHELGKSHEGKFMFSIILCGKNNLSALIRPGELGLRFDTHIMQPLTMNEMRAFAELHGIHADKKAINRLFANVHPTPMAVTRRIEELKYFFDKEEYNEADIAEYLRCGLPAKLKALSLSYAMVADALTDRGIACDKSVVSRALSGTMQDKSRQELILSEIDNIATEKIGDKIAAKKQAV